jgi:phage terminase large subunit
MPKVNKNIVKKPNARAFTEEQVLEQIRKYHGNLSAVAKAFHAGRGTIHKFVNMHPEVKIELFQVREAMLDAVENKFYNSTLAGNVTCMIFYLKTQGRSRGWIESRMLLGELPAVSGQSKSIPFPADVIAPSFLDVYRDIRDKKHTEYLFYGGRGSTKSSFVSLVTIWLMVNNPLVHALAVRQVANTLRDSVFSQLQWAINELGLSDSFKCTISPLEIEYIPTGQKIYFRGADDPLKIKSIKPQFGYIGILWFEELDQFHGAEPIRSIEQSALRGGDSAYIFKNFNPPRTANNWANKYVKIPKESQLQHSSNFLSVPPEWLGRTFLDEAEHLKEVNPMAYAHEYMGEITGSGGMVFENVKIREITDEEIFGKDDGLGHRIGGFDRVGQGLDWGYFPDPLAWGKSHFDANRRILYIFDEYKAVKKSNRAVYDDLVKIKGLTPEQLIIADSASPKDIADFREFGASMRGAEKGPESVTYSMKWLQSLTEIVIDPVRCPEHAQEFLNYELEMDKDGEYISSYPDRDNHFIDEVRYAHNLTWRIRGK